MSVLGNDLDNVLAQLSPFVKPVVDAIENGHAVTRNHYGDYMAAITRIAEMLGKDDAKLQRNVMLGIAIAMERAGANKQGVRDALRALGAL